MRLFSRDNSQNTIKVIFNRKVSYFCLSIFLISDGNAYHWSPYATNSTVRVMEGTLSTDSGFWDAWNTVYPLLTLSNRPMLGEMMTGWLNAYKEGRSICV